MSQTVALHRTGRLRPTFVVGIVLVLMSFAIGNAWLRRDWKVVRWVKVDELSTKLGLYESVFWEPLDTESFRHLIVTQPDFVRDKRVLEIGTGSGLLAICCKQSGAQTVVATDINPQAAACAIANSERAGMSIEVRLVPSNPEWLKDANDEAVDSTAFAVIEDHEKFDLIVSNPPWENSAAKQWSDFALYDEHFELLRSILVGARKHLRPGGRIVLIYGCAEAIEVTRGLAEEHDYDFLILDDRDPSSLPDVFLPGMMVGLVPRDSTNE